MRYNGEIKLTRDVVKLCFRSDQLSSLSHKSNTDYKAKFKTNVIV